ncbi:MAG: pilus assembly protein TadG-related protein [Verrucomicrobiia bacterium]
MRRITDRFRQREHGQTLIMFVLMLVVMLGFVGLGVDLGFAYITRARLSKAVDSACLNGMRNYWQGTTQASLIASNTFALNYGTSGRDVAPPSLAVSFVTSNNNTVLNVQASVVINTFFIGVLPAIGGNSWKTLTVGESAQATRTKVILALALDHSGSMNPDGGSTGGGAALPGAVTSFINYFSDTIDEASMASFGSTATNDVIMEQPFKSAITTAANNLQWCGGTYSVGGLTNALIQENSVTIPSSEVALKVVVFFTDGLANMVGQPFVCGGTTNTLIFGGIDPPGSGVYFFSTNTPYTCSAQSGSDNAYGCYISDDGSVSDPSGSSGCTPWCGISQFYATGNTNMESFTRANVTAEALAQCIQAANLMRANGILVYSIGLGGADVNIDFLAQVANATNSVNYNSQQPTGLALLADTPSQLQPYFTAVANDILFRLTQ